MFGTSMDATQLVDRLKVEIAAQRKSTILAIIVIFGL